MLRKNKLIAATAVVAAGAMMMTGCAAGTEPVDLKPTGNYIGIVEVHGDIGPSESGGSLLGTTSVGYDHEATMAFVDEMMDDDNNKAILLSLNTPGGTVYESDEMYLKLMEYKEETGRPIYAYMHSVAASGGYYIAAAADEIYANRNTTTGSIGVIMSGYDMSELFEKVGIKEIAITSGPNKAMGSAGTPMTEEQIAIYQSHVDEAYDTFVEIIALGRDMDEAKVREIADGRIYTAKQALELDLIDGIDVFEKYKEKVLDGFEDEVEFYVPEEPAEDFMRMLLGRIQNMLPKSDAQIMQEFCESNKIVPMYYYGG